LTRALLGSAGVWGISYHENGVGYYTSVNIKVAVGTHAVPVAVEILNKRR